MRKTREGNYYSLSNLLQSISLFSLPFLLACRADLWSKLEEAQDIFSLQRNAAEAKFKDLPSDHLNHLEKDINEHFLVNLFIKAV